MLKVKGTNFLKVSWNNLFWQRHDERFHALCEQRFLCREIIGDLIISALEPSPVTVVVKKMVLQYTKVVLRLREKLWRNNFPLLKIKIK